MLYIYSTKKLPKDLYDQPESTTVELVKNYLRTGVLIILTRSLWLNYVGRCRSTWPSRKHIESATGSHHTTRVCVPYWRLEARERPTTTTPLTRIPSLRINTLGLYPVAHPSSYGPVAPSDRRGLNFVERTAVGCNALTPCIRHLCSPFKFM